MKRFLFLAVASALFFSTHTFAQQNFQIGYIINLKGDTVRGKIDYRNWSFNPSKITFNGPSGAQEFRPLEIKAFFVSNDLYKSAIVEKEMSDFLKGTNSSSPQLVLRKDTTFLRALTPLPGKNIYHFKTRENIDQFYIPKGDEFELLVYKKYKMTNARGMQAETENKRYVGQLVLYLTGCETIQSKLKSTRYSANSFEDLILYYQHCLNPDIKPAEARLRIKTDVGILSGLTLMGVKFKGDQSPMQHYLSQADWSTSVNFSFGGFLNFTLPRNQGRWVLANELFFTSCNLKGNLLDQGTFQNYTRANSNFRMSYIRLNNLIRYRVPVHGRWVFLNIGMSNGNAFNVTNKQHVHTEFFGQVRDEDKEALDGFRKHELGLLTGVGFQSKRLTVEGRYEMANGFSEVINLACTTGRMHVLLALKLNK